MKDLFHFWKWLFMKNNVALKYELKFLEQKTELNFPLEWVS